MPDRRYETLVLLHPDLGEAGGHEQVARVQSLMEEKGASITAAHEWGQRDLAYPVREQRKAIFALFEFRASAAALAEIERNLRLMDPVLRFLSVRQDEDAPPAMELRSMEPRWSGGGEGGRGRDRGGWEGRDRRGADEVDLSNDGEVGDDDGDVVDAAASEEGV
jgi:small subunit ribosomal protein S6